MPAAPAGSRDVSYSILDSYTMCNGEVDAGLSMAQARGSFQ